MFRAAHALALCEQNGYELRMEATPLESIFTLDGYEPKRPDGTEDIVIDGYCQNQESLIYSRADCRRWFKLKPEIEQQLEPHWIKGGPLCDTPHVHYRRGDFASCGYPIIGARAVTKEMQRLIGSAWGMGVSDDSPLNDPRFIGDMAMLPDFYRLMRAPILFRANSSFSYWAGVLSKGRVFSPIITGLAGGVEHDNVPFVEGNWPRLAELEFVTDLFLPES